MMSCRRRVPAPAGFDAERAATHAKVLASLGPRTVGERALDAGLAYALREARRVPDAEVEEWRSGRGAVDHAQFLGGFVGVYDDVACVVARLKGRAEGKGAVLLNAHIDSAANAPGASDDLLAVGVLLEALNYFSKNRPRRDLIVLINGAEETHQLAAHAFATQHPAAEDVRFVVNLESMGSGGREFIFRCAGEDVALALRGTTVARGSVLAEELFWAVLWRAAASRGPFGPFPRHRRDVRENGFHTGARRARTTPSSCGRCRTRASGASTSPFWRTATRTTRPRTAAFP